MRAIPMTLDNLKISWIDANILPLHSCFVWVADNNGDITFAEYNETDKLFHNTKNPADIYPCVSYKDASRDFSCAMAVSKQNKDAAFSLLSAEARLRSAN